MVPVRNREQTWAESQAMSKSFRRGWIGCGMLLIGVVTAALWPRPIQIPLEDGTTLTIAAITVGTEHSRPAILTWARVWGQITRGQWEWPAQTITKRTPGVMLWFHGKPPERWRPVLIDRYGWRWDSSSGSSDQYSRQCVFRPIETDGTARVEVLGEDGVVHGTAVIPLPTAAPVDKAALGASIPPVDTVPGEPAPVPISRTIGPLEATLKSFDLHSLVENESSEGRFQLDTLWKGRPFPPQVGALTITDRFGRRERVFLQGDRPFLIHLPPRDAIWDLRFQLFRGPDIPLDPEETVVITPVMAAGETIFQQEGSHQGQAWRVSLSPTGGLSLRPKFSTGTISVSDEVPVIVAERASPHSERTRIEPLDQDGKRLPATPLDQSRLPVNVQGVRCPEFDVAKGHTIRVGIEQSQIVQFTVRPDEVSREPGEPPFPK